MDKVLRVMLAIEKEPDISQRQLAKSTGYSLGSVNGILQKLIDDKALVSKSITPNHYIYEITEQGMALKGMLLYDFILEGYDAIAKIRRHTKSEIQKAVDSGITRFYMVGKDDALYRLVKMCMIEYRRKADIEYEYLTDLKAINTQQPHRIFVWNKEYMSQQEHMINILLH